jgi:hypothetical protein
MSDDEFLEQLRSAFPPAPIHGADAFAKRGGSYPDAPAYVAAIDGKTWEELDREYIVRRHDAVGFLSDEHFVQVLPILLRSLVDDGVMSPVLDTMLVKLARPARAAITAQQGKAIASVLAKLAEDDPDGSPGRAAQQALDETWKKYL